MSRAFTILLALLIAGFFFVGEQHQRNWLLYVAAAAAHGFLFDRRTLCNAFAGRAGWTVPLLLAIPLLSLTWSGPVAGDVAADMVLAAYCILLVYLGVAHLAGNAPWAFERFQQALLLGANLGALMSLGHWAATYNPEWPRLPGWLGLDNPVHASVLLLAATLPVCTGIAQARLRLPWMGACALPVAFALLAGPRTALVAYVIVIAFVFRPRLRPRTLLAGAVVLGLAGGAALIGNEALRAIWIGRGLSFRPEIWSQAWSAFLSCNPLIGCGIAAPLEVEYLPGTVTDRAHSLYVAAIYHQGFLGAAVFVGAMGWLLHCVRGRGLAAPTVLAQREGEQANSPAAGPTAVEPDRAPAASAGKPLSAWRASLTGQRRDWAVVLVYVLLASTTSGDHILVRTTLFWCYFWLPVMVLAASTTALSERENSPAVPA